MKKGRYEIIVQDLPPGFKRFTPGPAPDTGTHALIVPDSGFVIEKMPAQLNTELSFFCFAFGYFWRYNFCILPGSFM